MTTQTALDFLEPINLAFLSDDEGYKENQIGKNISINEDGFTDIENADMIIIGCGEMRGNGIQFENSTSPDAVRKEFYKLFKWHTQVNVADVGNIKRGANIQDSYAALASVVKELTEQNKKVIILGGSHDVTLGQYNAYVQQEKIIEAVCIDAAIDLNMDSVLLADNFLMDFLTGEPNYVKHYTHIGFQSYLVHPQMLEIIDKLRFDCYRVGHVKGCVEEMEPAIRNANMLSFDIAAIQNAHAPANKLTPNGFDGEEACTLMQYAGMSNTISSIGIYGYNPNMDIDNLTAKQISNMLWYIMDGIHRSKFESNLNERENFNEYTLALANFETTFLQSKKTGRWWMKTIDEQYIPCSKSDYLMASQNEMPERWLRYAERL
jgi:formiminoglutamase